MKISARREWPCVIALLLLYLVMALVAPQFFSGDNLRDLALSNVSTLLVASGMTFVIVAGEIDISVGSSFAVASVLLGFLAKTGFGAILLFVSAVILGSALGAINGLLVSRLHAPSIVVTLATMVVLREGLRWLTGGAWVEGLPSSFQWFGFRQETGEVILIGIGLGLFLLMVWGARNLSVMRAVFAAGSDEEAARLAGIQVPTIVCLVFVLTGALTGIGALLNAVRFSDVPANSGINLELITIAAVVVGGTPITGGRGSLWGTLAGVALLGSIGPALTFLGIGPYWTKAIQGAIILITVFFDALNSRRERRLAAA